LHHTAQGKRGGLSLTAASTTDTPQGVQKWYVKGGNKKRKTCETGSSLTSVGDRMLDCHFKVDDLGSADNPDTSKQTWYAFMPQGNYPEWVVKFYDWDELLSIKNLTCDLEVPIQIEIEYPVEGTTVDRASISRKIRYNRPLLIKEAESHNADKLDELVNDHVQRAIEQHLTARGFFVESIPFSP
jgi:hypothetical protein